MTEEVEPVDVPEPKERTVDPVLVLHFLQQKAVNDKLLASQIEAATYRAAYEATLQ